MARRGGKTQEKINLFFMMNLYHTIISCIPLCDLQKKKRKFKECFEDILLYSSIPHTL